MGSNAGPFPISEFDAKDIDKWFTDHDWNTAQGESAARIEEAGKFLAITISANVPRCADRSAAIRKTREAVTTAIEGVRCEGPAYPPDVSVGGTP